MIAGVVSLLLALTLGGKDYPWGSWQIVSLFGLAAVFLTSFLWIEARVEEPILPLRLFANRTFSLLSAIGFLMSVGMFGAIMFVPLFMQGVIGISPSESGTVMLPMMLSMMATSIVGGRLVKTIGLRTQMVSGMVTMGIGFWLLSTMGVDTTKLEAMGFMVVLGLGIGLVMPLITIALQESFPKSELGVVTSSSQFFRQIGGTFGMTILGAVMNAQSTSLLGSKLVPYLEQLPTQAHSLVAQWKAMIDTNPQGLYSMLYSPEMLAKIPSRIQETLVPILKTAMVGSLHHVFLFGLVFVALGGLCTFFLGKIKLGTSDKAADMPVEAE